MRTTSIAVLALLLVTACKESPSQPAGAITVTVMPSPVLVQPGSNVAVTVTAVPTAGLSIDYILLTAAGVISERDSIPGVGASAQTFTRSYSIPFQIPPGDLTFSATAHAGRVTGTGSFKTTFADSLPPKIASLVVTPDSGAAPGDTITAAYMVTDNFGLRQAVLSWSGALTGADTLTMAYERYRSRTVLLPVPAGTPLGADVTFRLTVTDGANLRDTLSRGPIRIADLRPPTVSGGVTTPRSGVAYQPGEVLQISAAGTDKVGLAWLGYRITGAAGSIGDSVAASGLAASTSFTRSVGAWTGSSAVRVFARDRGGNLAETALGSVLVLGAPRARSIRTLTVAGNVLDLAVDETRAILYASIPDSSRVARISLATASQTGTIPVSSRPSRLDVTADGNTLVVALPVGGGLALVGSPYGSPSTRTVSLNPGGYSIGPDRLRIAANDKAIVSITFAGSGYGGSIWEYDLRTGTAAQHKEAGFYGNVTEATPMARSFDRSKILALIDDSCCPEDAMIYDSGTGLFGPAKGVVNSYFPSVSADYSGAFFLVSNLLLDAQLNRVGGFTPPGFSGASALGPAGFALFATGQAVTVVRLADGAIADTVALPFQPGLIQALADGHGFVAAGGNQLAIVTLW